MYDGDGARVKSISKIYKFDVNGNRDTASEEAVVTVFAGSLYETEKIENAGAVATKYYFAGGQRIATPALHRTQ